MKFIQELPEDIKIKISSYLYYSSDKAKHIKIVNGIVKNYSYYLLREMKILYNQDIKLLLLRLVLFIYTNPNISYKQEMYNKYILNNFNYENKKNMIYLIEKLMNTMNIIEKQKAYKFIVSYI